MAATTRCRSNRAEPARRPRHRRPPPHRARNEEAPRAGRSQGGARRPASCQSTEAAAGSSAARQIGSASAMVRPATARDLPITTAAMTPAATSPPAARPGRSGAGTTRASRRAASPARTAVTATTAATSTNACRGQATSTKRPAAGHDREHQPAARERLKHGRPRRPSRRRRAAVRPRPPTGPRARRPARRRRQAQRRMPRSPRRAARRRRRTTLPARMTTDTTPDRVRQPHRRLRSSKRHGGEHQRPPRDAERLAGEEQRKHGLNGRERHEPGADETGAQPVRQRDPGRHQRHQSGVARRGDRLHAEQVHVPGRVAVEHDEEQAHRGERLRRGGQPPPQRDRGRQQMPTPSPRPGSRPGP